MKFVRKYFLVLRVEVQPSSNSLQQIVDGKDLRKFPLNYGKEENGIMSVRDAESIITSPFTGLGFYLYTPRK